MGFNAPRETFECASVRLSIENVVEGVQSSELIFTGLTEEPATTAAMECTNPATCEPALKRLFDLIANGQVSLHYYVIFGSMSGRTVRNPKPIFTFPLWAIGLIIGGAIAVSLLILLLCIVCTRKKQRRKRRPLKSQAPLYVPLTEQGAGVGGGDVVDETIPIQRDVTRSDVEDVDMPFEVLFSVKKSDKPEALLVNRKETVQIKTSDWDARTDVVRATNSKGESGFLPSTHVKSKSSRKSTLKGSKK